MKERNEAIISRASVAIYYCNKEGVFTIDYVDKETLSFMITNNTTGETERIHATDVSDDDSFVYGTKIKVSEGFVTKF